MHLPPTRQTMRHMGAFVRLARPMFLVGGCAAFALGAAVAVYEGAPLTAGRYVAGQVMVTAFQLMTHFANDYYDRGVDERTERTAFSGGSGVLVRGELSPGIALAAAGACAGLGLAAVAGFVLAGMPVEAVLGAAIGALAWFYSAPPVRLAARGWGELDTALVVAVLVPLAGYSALCGTVDRLAWAATLGPGLAMFAMMIAVEWPDHAADAAGGKRNLVVRLNAARAGGLAAAAALLVVPALCLPLALGAPPAGGLFALMLLPPIVTLARRFAAPAVPAAELAARGVSFFILTVLFELFGYVAVMH